MVSLAEDMQWVIPSTKESDTVFSDFLVEHHFRYKTSVPFSVTIIFTTFQFLSDSKEKFQIRASSHRRSKQLPANGIVTQLF